LGWGEDGVVVHHDYGSFKNIEKGTPQVAVVISGFNAHVLSLSYLRSEKPTVNGSSDRSKRKV